MTKIIKKLKMLSTQVDKQCQLGYISVSYQYFIEDFNMAVAKKVKKTAEKLVKSKKTTAKVKSVAKTAKKLPLKKSKTEK